MCNNASHHLATKGQVLGGAPLGLLQGEATKITREILDLTNSTKGKIKQPFPIAKKSTKTYKLLLLGWNRTHISIFM